MNIDMILHVAFVDALAALAGCGGLGVAAGLVAGRYKSRKAAADAREDGVWDGYERGYDDGFRHGEAYVEHPEHPIGYYGEWGVPAFPADADGQRRNR